MQLNTSKNRHRYKTEAFHYISINVDFDHFDLSGLHFVSFKSYKWMSENDNGVRELIGNSELLKSVVL